MTTVARTVLIVNPSADVYGADLQMLETVVALVEDGRRVVVALPADGPLVRRLHDVGAEIYYLDYPVLSKGRAKAGALPHLLLHGASALVRGVKFLRFLQPSLLLVNTITLPWWLLAGRLAGVPTVGYLHEAETESRRLVRRALIAPLRLSQAVIVISRAAFSAMEDVEPSLADRAHLIYNGVPQPPDDIALADPHVPSRFVVVGRLSPRKAPVVALEALAVLVSRGIDARLEVAGSTFAGYEWYEDQLRERAARPDLAGRVTFSGYCSPIWPVLARNDYVLAPSLREPFGNAVVEAQLARRPVVAAASQGHLESVTDDETGLLVEPGDVEQMAEAMLRLIREPSTASRLAEHARSEAVRRFSVARYRREVVQLIDELAR